MLYYFVLLLWWGMAEYLVFLVWLTSCKEVILGHQPLQCQKAFYVTYIKSTTLSTQSVCFLRYPATCLAALDSFKLKSRPKASFSWSTWFINISDEQKKWQKHQCNISFSKPGCWISFSASYLFGSLALDRWFVSLSSMNTFKTINKKWLGKICTAELCENILILTVLL